MTSDTYLPDIGGAEIHVFELQKHLREQGHQITLFVTNLKSAEQDIKYPVIRTFWSLKRAPKIIYEIWKQSKDTETFHSHYSYKLAALNGIVAAIKRKPFFVTLHGMGILDHPNTPWIYDKSHRLYRWLSLHLATSVISTSQDLADVCARHINDSKIKVVPNGIDTSLFNANTIQPLQDQRLENVGPLLLTIRRLVPKNGIHYAISVLPFILQKYPNAKLVMVGDGRMREQLEERAKKLGVYEACIFMGTLPNDQVAPIAVRSDIVLFPSTAESTSIACAEMMSLGKKIVASRVGGLIELLGKNEERGWLAKLVPWESCNYDAPLELSEDKYREFASLILSALEDPNSINKTSAAREYAVNSLDWSVVVRKTTEIYSGLSKKTENKDFYKDHADKIWDKRFNSPFAIRRHAHRKQYKLLLDEVLPGTILDAGCGEGVISMLLAAQNIASTGVDLSEPNIKEARERAENQNISNLARFDVADAESLPFADKSFDTVISSHVLEHLPDFDKGFKELCRVSRKRVIVALPTCLNLCAAALLGGDHGYWKLSKRSLFALPWGVIKIVGNIFGEGVQEGYAGQDDLPHIWRYPWVMRRRLRHPEFKMTKFCASTFVLPYAEFTLSLVKKIERHNSAPILRNFGYGSFAVLDRVIDK